MKVQTSRGILYHDMQKQLGRRKGLEGRRIGGACWRRERDTHEGWVGGSEAQSLSSSILLREGKKGRYETEEDNGEQTNESVRYHEQSYTNEAYLLQASAMTAERRGVQ